MVREYTDHEGWQYFRQDPEHDAGIKDKITADTVYDVYLTIKNITDYFQSTKIPKFTKKTQGQEKISEYEDNFNFGTDSIIGYIRHERNNGVRVKMKSGGSGRIDRYTQRRMKIKDDLEQLHNSTAEHRLKTKYTETSIHEVEAAVVEDIRLYLGSEGLNELLDEIDVGGNNLIDFIAFYTYELDPENYSGEELIVINNLAEGILNIEYINNTKALEFWENRRTIFDKQTDRITSSRAADEETSKRADFIDQLVG